MGESWWVLKRRHKYGLRESLNANCGTRTHQWKHFRIKTITSDETKFIRYFNIVKLISTPSKYKIVSSK